MYQIIKIFNQEMGTADLHWKLTSVFLPRGI